MYVWLLVQSSIPPKDIPRTLILFTSDDRTSHDFHFSHLNAEYSMSTLIVSA